MSQCPSLGLPNLGVLGLDSQFSLSQVLRISNHCDSAISHISLLYLYNAFLIHFTLFNPLMLVVSGRQEKCSHFLERKPE